MSFVFMVVSLFSMEKNDLNHNSQIILTKTVNYFKASSTTQGFSTEAWKSLPSFISINNLKGRHIRDICTLLKKSNDVNGFLTHVGVAMISDEIDNRAALMHFFDRLVPVGLRCCLKKEFVEKSLVESEDFLTFEELSEFFAECNKKRAVFLKEKMDELHICKITCDHYFEQIKILKKQNSELQAGPKSPGQPIEPSSLKEAALLKNQLESSKKRSSQERNILILAVLFLAAYILKLKLL